MAVFWNDTFAPGQRYSDLCERHPEYVIQGTASHQDREATVQEMPMGYFPRLQPVVAKATIVG